MPSQVALDRDLQEAGCAEDRLVARIAYESAGSLGKALWEHGRPQEQMGVQQQSHGSPSNIAEISASPMRSKSSGTEKSPTRNPNRRGAVGASNAVTFTNG